MFLFEEGEKLEVLAKIFTLEWKYLQPKFQVQNYFVLTKYLVIRKWDITILALKSWFS